VLSSSKIGTASWRYYQQTVSAGACEYYLAPADTPGEAPGEAPGVWVGRGLAEFGLEAGAQVTEAQLEAIFGRALHPGTGTRLGRGWRADGVTGFDLTFSAPKSVSVVWALGGVTAATQVDAAHRAAVTAALAYLDEHAALSRTGTDGVQQISTEGLVAALFDHRTSRAEDPQLHTHALVPNKLLCADGVWRTIDGHEIYHHKKAAGAIYQAALRAELTTRLGIVFGPANAHGQAEILGIPTELITEWSKRTAQIAAEADPVIAEYEAILGRELTPTERAAVVKTAVLKTRTAKELASSQAVLRQQWRTEAATLGWDAVTLHDTLSSAAAAHLAAGGDNERGVDFSAAAVTAAGARHGVFSVADLTVQVAARLPAAPRTAEQARFMIAVETLAGVIGRDDVTAVLRAAVPLGAVSSGVTPRASDRRFTSRQVLAAEHRILAAADTGRRRGIGRVPPSAVSEITQAGLALDQAAAVHQMTGGGDLVTVLTAPAGAGKTTTLGAAARTWRHAGYRVIGLAPSARAAAELSVATGGHTDTLAKWLHEQARLPHLPDAERRRWTTTARTVLILDEASMASTFDLDTLVTVAARAHAKVVLVGDPAQIGVINGPGGMLTALTTRGHGVQLTDIHRFTHDWEADASLRLRAGDPTVIGTYAKAGRLHTIPDPDQAIAAVFAHWQEAGSQGQGAMMLARTRDDVRQLNALAKAAAQLSGHSHGPVVIIGDQTFQAGDVIRTRRNQRTIPTADGGHVRNGDRYTILATTETGGLLVQNLTGNGRTLLPATYVTRHVEHGWASTIDAAQGATTDTAILLIRPGLDRQHLYVGLTRGRHENHAYLTNTAADDNHQPVKPTVDTGHRTLVAALATVAEGDAAHTLLDRANTANPEQARHQRAIRPAEPEHTTYRPRAAHTQPARSVHHGPRI
jgi:conjugative relaxase-like TrwC/TraI family protein